LERSLDARSRELRDQLLSLKTALRGNERVHPLPVSADFYWQGIERRILQEERQRQPAPAAETLPFPIFLIRRVLPVLGTLALVLAISMTLWLPMRGERVASLGTNHDIENTSEDISTMSFRSESEGITVVWVAARDFE